MLVSLGPRQRWDTLWTRPKYAQYDGGACTGTESLGVNAVEFLLQVLGPVGTATAHAYETVM